jgi:hypothetical protein
MLEKLLLCVGAQKAGTSWLHNMLTRSPDIKFSRLKEIHYLDMQAGLNDQLPQHLLASVARQFGLSRDAFLARLPGNEKAALQSIKSILDDQWYFDQFGQHQGYCADFTPEYALLSTADLKATQRLAKQRKVIFIMRDPVERSLSAFRYYHQNRGIDIGQMSNRKIKSLLSSRLFARRSDYPKVIDKLSQSFSPEDVLYLFYEDVMAEKRAAIERVCKFLNIDMFDLGEERLNKKINISTPLSFDEEIRAFLSKKFAKDKQRVKRELGHIPQQWEGQ